MGLIRVEMTEDRINELEVGQKNLSNMNKRKKTDWKQKNRASETCETVTEYPMFISSESQKENKKRGAERVFKKIIAENFPNLVKGINLKIQEAEQTSNR